MNVFKVKIVIWIDYHTNHPDSQSFLLKKLDFITKNHVALRVI
ncbi:hypothetical protein BN863_15340 [Formosa agariphila KMM 3901]|uniref:Uncharacterized protein n=1 Tax=Formosa agariphila (strain DSM 15362 / KCTC 12365 / LMG 23005 / KMM 3901 / M-2Alg 35-1) TaxID=1347342 RepID=T2KLD4_FORAG|nr:hypothetical protein BN863_15340 [Formosa agariphila KMM 3901]